MEVPVFTKEREVLRRYYGSRGFLEALKKFRKRRGRLCVFFGVFFPLSFFLGVPGVLGSIGTFLYLFSRESLRMGKEVLKRRWEFLKEYPDFLMYIKLFLESGSTFMEAVKSYELRRDGGYYLKKVFAYFRRIGLGESREGVLYEAGQDLMEKEILKLMHFYNYYTVYGSVGLDFLEALGAESIKLKKESVKKKGEEASAKLVLPMMLIFLGILLLVIGPSIMTLKGG